MRKPGSHRIFCLMGKSASGKDTIYQRLLNRKDLGLSKVVPYTTRPIREGEVEGREYFFSEEENFHTLESEGKIIESRCYQTVYGPWYYFTPDDGQIDLTKQNFIVIGTLESYLSFRNYFGEETVIPIYIWVEESLRLKRALGREQKQEVPHIEEMKRRFQADAIDFSEEKLSAAGILHRFENTNLEACTEEIAAYIAKES